jgi:hypothetical protein
MSSRNIKSRWFGLKPRQIVQLWEDENNRSTEAGHWWHSKMEKRAINIGEKEHRGKIIKVFETPTINGIKLARNQELIDGIYPEHIVYNEEYGVCGQTDLPLVADFVLDIGDYKTNKNLKFTSYGHEWGNPRMMRGPVSHLEDCNVIHYTLQVSIYMKLILLKNPKLKPGDLKLIHVEFEKKGCDKYGFPILKKINNQYVVEKITKHKVPYLEKEASDVLKYISRGN